ncbi:uncharacterized protein LOC111013216 [Momordica charantia]|uniref:Uncharacterized protein LOC111013216 n=1 Tax=Momordica charantia TaxID=3673 RepID=A0A6J1CQG0_MOMCH|nr:uncharacterized protein LOC111013216 [Momordica charantia]
MVEHFYGNVRVHWTNKDSWNWLVNMLSDEEVATSMVIAWQIWESRNRSIFRGETIDEQQLDRSIVLFINSNIDKGTCISQTRRSQQNDGYLPRGRENLNMLGVRWSAPPTNCWKLNTDASWSEEREVGGIGWILCDCRGEIVLAGNCKIREKKEINALELMTIIRGLQFINMQSRSPIYLESDSVEVIRLMKKEDVDLT